MKNLSTKVVILIGILFLISYSVKISKSISNKDNCICAYDGFGYYMYLPSLFEKGTLYMDKEWAQGLQNEYCEGVEAYQLIHSKNGNYIDVYHIGMAYLEMPAYLISSQIASWLGYKKDGFSKPYQIGFLINALLFILIGLYYARKLLLLFVKDKYVAITLLSFYFASNFFITSYWQYSLPHIYLFALNSIFLYHFFKYINSKEKKSLIISACILGLSFAIRPTQVVWGIIPLIHLYNNGSRMKFSKNILLFPLFAILWNIPQLLYWKIVGGELFLPNLHTEEIILSDPNLYDFLFSFRKGWLIYSPFFILFFIGLIKVYKSNRKLFWSITIFSLLYIYIVSSWECWWYAASFGARPMIDIYPIILIPIGFLIYSLKTLVSKIVLSAFIFLAILLNILQNIQFDIGYMHSERMTSEHYLYIFGKTNIKDYSDHRLLMDRGNLNWINKVKDNYLLKEGSIFQLQQTLTALPFQDLTIGEFIVSEKLKTDETLITAEMEYTSSDNSKSSYLRIETCSKYNCYDWQTNEISLITQNDSIKKLEIKFNLRDIRHTDDFIQMYLNNPNDVEINIKSFKVTAQSILRNSN